MLRCLQLARTHRKWGIMCVNWMWLTTREPYPSCPSDWSQGGAKNQCSESFSRFSLSLWNTTTVYPVYNSTTQFHVYQLLEQLNADCMCYHCQLNYMCKMHSHMYDCLCACASCMLMTSVIRATLVDSVCLCVCKQNALGKSVHP